MLREEAYKGMHVWAIAENEPYECVIQELGARSDINKCELNFANRAKVPRGVRIGWRRYDQVAPYGESLDLEGLRRATLEPDPLTPKQQMDEQAKVLHFDVLRGINRENSYRDSKYFVVCDWNAKLVSMLANEEYGYNQAVEWMKLQREGAFSLGADVP
jgi:hypothetical protein